MKKQVDPITYQPDALGYTMDCHGGFIDIGNGSANYLNASSPAPIGRRTEADVLHRSYTQILLLPTQLSVRIFAPLAVPIPGIAKGRLTGRGDAGWADTLEG